MTSSPLTTLGQETLCAYSTLYATASAQYTHEALLQTLRSLFALQIIGFGVIIYSSLLSSSLSTKVCILFC